MASLMVEAQGSRRQWPPHALADWEIDRDVLDPATPPARRAALIAERDERKRLRDERKRLRAEARLDALAEAAAATQAAIAGGWA